MAKKPTASDLATRHPRLFAFAETNLASRFEAHEGDVLELLWRLTWTSRRDERRQERLLDIANDFEELSRDREVDEITIEQCFAGGAVEGTRFLIAEHARAQLRMLSTHLSFLVIRPTHDTAQAEASIQAAFASGMASCSGSDFLAELHTVVTSSSSARARVMGALVNASAQARLLPTALKDREDPLWSERNAQAFVLAVTQYALLAYLHESLDQAHDIALPPDVLERLAPSHLRAALSAFHAFAFPQHDTKRHSTAVAAYESAVNELRRRLESQGDLDGACDLAKSFRVSADGLRHGRVRDAVAYANNCVERATDWPEDKSRANALFAELLRPLTGSPEIVASLARDAERLVRRSRRTRQ